MRPVRLAPVLLALTTLSTLAACVGPMMASQPLVVAEAQPGTAAGYVGVVAHKATVVRFGFGLLAQGTQKEYVLPLNEGVSLVELPPGQYRVAFWETAVAMTGERMTRKVVPETEPLGKPFELGAGSVVVLGKWLVDREIGFGTNTFTIASQDLDAQAAAAAVREKYPRFAGAPTTCPGCKQ